MKLKITKGNIKEHITVPASKSWANRYLILAAISKEPTTVKNCPDSTDVEAMIKSFLHIGLKVARSGADVIVSNSFPECESETVGSVIELESGDGGTTNRFLLPLLSRGMKDYIIKTSFEFLQRPKKEFVDIFQKYGMNLESGGDQFWLKVYGGHKFNSSKIHVDCSKSTQFISGLMLAYADMPIEFVAENLKSSESYYEMTKRSIVEFKSGSTEFITPVDFSSLSYPLVFSIDQQEINFTNCMSVDKFQADSFLIEFLKHKGVHFDFCKDGLFVKSKNFNKSPFKLSCRGFPDLVPSLVFLMCLCEGESQLMELEVLTYKESDRFNEMVKILLAAGVPHKVDHESFSLSINGPVSKINNANFDLPPDHRMVMLASMLVKRFGEGSVNQASHVKKSYPNFFKDFDV